MAYSQKKFCAQTLEKQHKECALILKTLIEQGDASLWDIYCEWLGWMKLTPPPYTAKHLADRYHQHLSQTRIHLKEHNFLQVHTQDREDAAPSLNHTIYLDNIRSAHNVGSIIRTTEAFSLGQLIFGGITPLPTHKQVHDTAMGTADWVEWKQGTVDEGPRPLIALETAENAIPMNQFSFPIQCTIALGNEEYGCSDEVLQKADMILQIPLFGRKNSLNVANAFACAAHQIRTQS